MLLRKIYEPVRNESTEDYERRKNTDLESPYNKPNIKCFLKTKPLEQTGHVWCAKGSIIQRVLINKPIGNLPRGSPRQRQQDRDNLDIRMINGTANIETATDHEVWRGLIESAKSLGDP